MFYSLLVRLLFLFPAETAHKLTMSGLRVICSVGFGRALIRIMVPKTSRETLTVMGLNFSNRVGLAAGFDKDADNLRVWETLGFGFVEVGTVTPKPQEGNPKPRLFRLVKDQAIINRMGFNNQGLDHMIGQLRCFQSKRHPRLIIGGNIGKNKVTPNEEANSDYIRCFEGLYPYVDYFVVNVSSPNTPGLRELQEKAPLTSLLSELCMMRRGFTAEGKPHRPILLKIAPDVTIEQLDDMVDIVNFSEVEGMVVNNTTIDRSGLKTPAGQVEDIGAGGLSGKPLKDKAHTTLKEAVQRLKKDKVVIGVGGIMNDEDGAERIQSGADLIQVYTGFIYGGPPLIRDLSKL
jgi:dihydroorotate dehydrogenase